MLSYLKKNMAIYQMIVVAISFAHVWGENLAGNKLFLQFLFQHLILFTTGCQYIMIMEPLSELYCNPYTIDADINQVYTGCALVYPLSEEGVSGFQWFRNIETPEGTTSQQISTSIESLTLEEENSSHATMMALVRINLEESLRPQEFWCRALLNNGTLLSNSQVMTVLSSPTYSIRPRCLRQDILASFTSQCADQFPSSTPSNESSSGQQSIVPELKMCSSSSIAITRSSVSRDLELQTVSKTEVDSAALLVSSSSPTLSQSGSTISNNFSIFLGSSLPVAAILLICIVAQFMVNLALCCMHKKNKHSLEKKNFPLRSESMVYHQCVQHVPSLESPFYNLKPAYYITPISTPHNDAQTYSITSSKESRSTADLPDIYDSFSGLYHEISSEDSSNANSTYASLTAGTLNKNSLYTSTPNRV